MTLKTEIATYRNIIDKELEKLFDFKGGYENIIYESMKYSVFSGGKRLRPILVLKSCELFNNSFEDAIPYALAIELIHTYSLIHDDLPAMDNDDYRRGKLTNHKLYGEAIAILTGDALLNMAFENMIESINNCNDDKIKCNRYISAMAIIAEMSGTKGMIGGQVIDIMSDKAEVDEDILYYMYRNKTAALLIASVVAGGIIGGANSEEINLLKKYGLLIGLGYQIRDDILDYEEDKKCKKTTYLKFHDIDNSKKKIAQLTNDAKEIMSNFKSENIRFFNEFADYLIVRKI